MSRKDPSEIQQLTAEDLMEVMREQVWATTRSFILSGQDPQWFVEKGYCSLAEAFVWQQEHLNQVLKHQVWERKRARTAEIPCHCGLCVDSSSDPAVRLLHDWDFEVAPEEFLDGSDELRLWLESAPNLGADSATAFVHALLDGED